jgi:hypothetical protein
VQLQQHSLPAAAACVGQCLPGWLPGWLGHSALQTLPRVTQTLQTAAGPAIHTQDTDNVCVPMPLQHAECTSSVHLRTQCHTQWEVHFFGLGGDCFVKFCVVSKHAEEVCEGTELCFSSLACDILRPKTHTSCCLTISLTTLVGPCSCKSISTLSGSLLWIPHPQCSPFPSPPPTPHAVDSPSP